MKVAALRFNLELASRKATGTIRRFLWSELATMHPSYFAFVMATGIVALGGYQLGLPEIATVLALINIFAYPLLCGLFIARLVFYPKQFLSDWTSHQRAPGFFTAIAATGIMGAQFAVIHQAPAFAEILWWIGLGLWIIFTYSIFAALTVQAEKPSLSDGIHGGWLIAVVATQSITVLGCAAGANMLGTKEATLFLLVSFWLCGGMLYLWIIGLIFYRYMFFPFSPRDFMPPYWINMGAVAISTLAGARLSDVVQASHLLSQIHPFVIGLTLMFWATATWWIPMLLILGVWRHRVKRIPINYDPLYWGLVFPFGMYSVCTLYLSKTLDASFLMWISKGAIGIAVSAWLITFLGLMGQLLKIPLFARMQVAASTNRNQTRKNP